MIIGTATALIFLAASPAFSLSGDQWYIGGTLHSATVGQWHQASYANKLATAASWALMQPDVRNISRQSSTMDTVRPYAEELVGCIDKVTIGASYDDKTVSGLAAACMVSFGW